MELLYLLLAQGKLTIKIKLDLMSNKLIENHRFLYMEIDVLNI